MVGFVADVSVAGAPGLDAIVVGIRRVVLHENIAARNPAVEDADEDSVSALGDVVAQPIIVIGTAFEQDGGGIPRMHFAGGAVDADAIRKIVPQETIAGRVPKLGAGVRTMGKVVFFNRVLIGVHQMQPIPNPVGVISSKQTPVRSLKENSSAR